MKCVRTIILHCCANQVIPKIILSGSMFQQSSSKGSKAVVSHRDNKNFSLLENFGSPVSADFHIRLDPTPLICQTPTENNWKVSARKIRPLNKNAILPPGTNKMVGVLDAYLQAVKIQLVKNQGSIVTIETGHLLEMYYQSFRIIFKHCCFLIGN